MLPVVPDKSLVPNRVYSLPADLGNVHKIDKRVLAKAEKLSLHPNQEQIRFNKAKALVSHKPLSPKSKAKSGLLSRVLKRLTRLRL